MVARNLLHKDKLEGFKLWLDSRGREHRPGRGDWQALQIRHGAGWLPIFTRREMQEHLSVPGPIIPLVQAYIREGREAAVTGAAKELAVPIPPANQDTPPWE